MRLTFRPPVFAAALVVALALPPSAGAKTADLSGVIFTIGADQVQTVWPNARVTLKNLKTGEGIATVSSELGVYSFTGVETGEYEITVVLAPAPATPDTLPEQEAIEAVGELVAAGLPRRTAADLVARLTGQSKNRLYRASL